MPKDKSHLTDYDSLALPIKDMFNQIEGMGLQTIMLMHEKFWESKLNQKKIERINSMFKTEKDKRAILNWNDSHSSLGPVSYSYIFFKKSYQELNNLIKRLKGAINFYQKMITGVENITDWAFQTNLSIIFLLDRIKNFLVIFLTLNYFEFKKDGQIKCDKFRTKSHKINKNQLSELSDVNQWRKYFFHNFSFKQQKKLTIKPLGALHWNSYRSSIHPVWKLPPFIEYDARNYLKQKKYKVLKKQPENNLLKLTCIVLKKLLASLNSTHKQESDVISWT